MKEILRRHSFSIAFVLLVFAFFFTRPEPGNRDLLQLSGFTMGTSYRLQFIELPAGHTFLQLQQRVNALLQKLDREIFSTYSPDSELTRINQAPIQIPVSVSPEMLEVSLLAQQISEQTDGAFDITVGPLVNLWGFGPVATGDEVPEDSVIRQTQSRVSYRFLQVDAAASSLTKTRDIYLDMSGIAKGFAVDEIAELFDLLGINEYFLEIGGEIKIKGYKPGMQSWVPALERPVDAAPQVHAVLYSQGAEVALAGSGDYRNYFNQDGVRYSHEIDPASGRPVTHNLAAVYVMDSSAARADALATAFMVKGLDAGRALADRLQQPVYFIYRDADGGFGEYYTKQFAAYLQP
jgi:FAD:protein FMN transferase